MFKPLNDIEMAKLQAKFIVPMVIDHMLHDAEPLDDIAEQAMYDIISELQPDTALLCIALSAQHIAAAAPHIPAGNALALESHKIITEYGPLWIAYDNGEKMADSAVIRDILSYIPEDLESLHTLMENLVACLDEDHCVAAILCDILCDLIERHVTAAEQQLRAINLAPQSRNTAFSIAAAPHMPSQAAMETADNIIAFPVMHSRSIPP